MLIEISVCPVLRVQLGMSKAVVRVALDEGGTVADAVATLRIPPEQPYLVTVNGKHARVDSELLENDSLYMFAPAGFG